MNNTKKDYLSLENTKLLKGILCVLIIIHHIYQYRFVEFVHPLLGGVLQNMGFWCVAVFFFISGYGLTYSLLHKKDYLKGFLKNKLFPLIISYFVFSLIYYIYNKYFNKANIQIIDFFEGLLFGYDKNSLWFLQSLIFMYIVFYLSFFKAKHELLKMFLGIIIYLLLCCLIRCGMSYYATIICFPLGVYWNQNKERIDSYIYKRPTFSFIVFFLLFTSTFILSKIISKKLLIVSNIIFMISNILFIILFFTIFKSIKYKNTIFVKLSTYSLEIYAIQFLFIDILKDVNILLYIPLLFFLVIIVAIFLNKSIKKIIDIIQKIFNHIKGLDRSIIYENSSN